MTIRPIAILRNMLMPPSRKNNSNVAIVSAEQFENGLWLAKRDKELAFCVFLFIYTILASMMHIFQSYSATPVVISLTMFSVRSYGLFRRRWTISDSNISTFSAIALFVEMLGHLSMQPKNWCLFPSSISELWFGDVVQCPRDFFTDVSYVYDLNFLFMGLNLIYMIASSLTFKQSVSVSAAVEFLRLGIPLVTWFAYGLPPPRTWGCEYSKWDTESITDTLKNTCYTMIPLFVWLGVACAARKQRGWDSILEGGRVQGWESETGTT